MPGCTIPCPTALIYLAAHHGRAMSRNALLAGPPDHGWPSRLGAARARGGTRRPEVEPVKRALADIPALVCPAI